MTYADRDDRQGDMFAVPRLPPEVPPEEHDGHFEVGAWPMDCLNADGYRPCPYPVRCRHHLLFNDVQSEAGVPALTLNQARHPDLVQLRTRGRYEEVARAETNYAKLEGFAITALERLWELPDTCSREVARRAAMASEDSSEPAMTFPEIAAVLGIGDPDELAEEFADHRAGLRGEVIEAGGDPDVEESAVEALVRKFYAWSDEHAAAYERLATFFDCARHEVDRMIDRVLAGRGSINRGR